MPPAETSWGPYTMASTFVFPCSRYALPSALIQVRERESIVSSRQWLWNARSASPTFESARDGTQCAEGRSAAGHRAEDPLVIRIRPCFRVISFRWPLDGYRSTLALGTEKTCVRQTSPDHGECHTLPRVNWHCFHCFMLIHCLLSFFIFFVD